MIKIEIYDSDATKIMKIASRYGITMAAVVEDMVAAFMEGENIDTASDQGAEEI